MELLYGTADQDFTMRRQAVMSLVRKKDEPARQFSRRILLKAVQANLRMELRTSWLSGSSQVISMMSLLRQSCERCTVKEVAPSQTW